MGDSGGGRGQQWLAGIGVAVAVVSLGAAALLVVPVVDGFGRPTPQALGPSAEIFTPLIVPAPPPSGTLTGVVTDDSGRPLQGVHVNADGARLSSSGLTNRRGRYRIEVYAGPYRVSFGGPGGASYALEFHPDVPTSDLAELVTVEEGATTAVDAEVSPGARLSGRVFDATGRPVALRNSYAEIVHVEAWLPTRKGRRWTPLEEVRMDAGRYALTGLPPGRYRVRFDHPRIGTVYHPAATRPGTARHVRLSRGERVAGVDVRIPPPATLTGRVLSARGLPLAGVPILSWSRIHGVRMGAGSMWQMVDPRRTTTDADGRYAFTGLGTGTYTVSPGKAPPGDFLIGSPCRALHDESVRVDAGLPATRDLRAESRARARLHGVVTDQAGRPLPGVTVRAVSVSGTSCQRRTRTDPSGRYSLELFTGRYRVHFQPRRSGRSTFLPEYHDDARRREADTLRLPAWGARVDAALTEGGRISGRLTTLDGTPLSEVLLHLEGAGDRMPLIRPEPSGRFSWEGVPLGTSVVAIYPSITAGQVVDTPDLYVAGEAVVVTSGAATKVTIQPGRHVRLGRINLDVGGVLSGRVTDRRGRPVRWTRVVAQRRAPDGTWRRFAGEQTGWRGRYEIRGLSAGVFRLEIGDPDMPEGSTVVADELELDSGDVVRGIDLVVARP